MPVKKKHDGHVQNDKRLTDVRTKYKTKNTTGQTANSAGSRTCGVSKKYVAMAFAIAAVCGIVHRHHVSSLFENDRHFSHLSRLERELAFRTEMGLYYSYFKTIIEAPSFVSGMGEVMYDNVTEFPLTINVLKRFNLYPEVLVGAAFRIFDQVTTYFNIPTKVCWTVNRGNGMSPVPSCEGVGEPHYFYVESVFLLHGLLMSTFFLFGTYLSGSIIGGLISVLSYFYNHGECTRVMWTPPLRESFAYPFFVLEMFLVTHILRLPRPQLGHSLLLGLSISSFMLPWQFAQFALLTQILAVYGTYVLMYIGSYKMKCILKGHLLGLLISCIFLFGNEMLLTSFYSSCLLSITMVVLMEPLLEKLPHRLLIWGCQGGFVIGGTVLIKKILAVALRVADDAHIGEIFKSKFTDFKNFNTMLYTCAVEFDFLGFEAPIKLMKTLLLPVTILIVAVIFIHMFNSEWSNWKTSVSVSGDAENKKEATEHRSKPDAELLYHCFQLMAFTVMAVLIMRLKLFWTPHMCLLSCLLASKQLFSWVGSTNRRLTLLGVVVVAMSIQGSMNLRDQWKVQGEFSNYPMEQMVEWIKSATPKDAVFAGSMPTMATIKLCTYRPIVNHPHYEDAGLRERTKKVYTMYSRKPLETVWKNYMDLKIDYAIFEEGWCVARSKPGCSMPEIWDLEDTEHRHLPSVCGEINRNPAPYFQSVFKNQVFNILKVIKTPLHS